MRPAPPRFHADAPAHPARRGFLLSSSLACAAFALGCTRQSEAAAKTAAAPKNVRLVDFSNAGKRLQERFLAEGAVPWSVLRATQFHEFAGQVAAQARVGPLQLAPRARVQPIAADAVASHLVSLAEGDPQGRSTDIAGPQEEQLSRMVREWERHAGHRRPVLPVDIPSAQMRGMRRGLALPGPDALILGPRFADWLSRR